MTIPFPPVDGDFGARQVAISPEGTAYVVPSGMHERLRAMVAPDREDRDPKVALALSGWTCLQSDGMTDRINVDAPDAFADETPIRRFAQAHDAGSVAVARHPSGEVCRSNDPAAFTFE
ncbi:hypothetical protein SAMN06269185_1409 [Natronoarchaeum philippinense]|uniref:Uncharacterized protein n=1 Tax=Natronoarchaeum philippinense TaxID=558529 RepID=A0A285NVE2_NATPI|nr:hypothetical protein [Natronoarchaeum philippinense]SNZ11846.1 hypothetical protein SAMN06269185_1409 [Natronoarchaeum philippinense]